MRCWGLPPHDLLRGLDHVFKLTFEASELHQHAGALANPAVAKVEELYAQKLDAPVPTEAELWPSTIRRLQLSYAKRGKHELVAPPLPRLEHLFVSDCKVSDLQRLEGLPSLRSLYLSGCEVESLDGLGALSRLQSLTIYNDEDRVAILDISALASLSALEELSVRHASVGDIEVIGGLQKLRKLELFELSKITSLAPLAELKNLRELTVHGSNAVESLAPLGMLARLERINVLHYPPRRKSVSLRSLRDLERLVAPKQTKQTKQTKKTKTKKTRAKRKALVLRLEELSALPLLIEACCHVARGGQCHRPAREYMQYTYVVASGQRPLVLPKEDPSVPVDDDFPPGFLNGLLECIEDLPKLDRLMRPRGGQHRCFVASHCTATPDELSEFLEGTGHEILRVTDLLPDLPPEGDDGWDAFDEAATAEVGPGLLQYIHEGKGKPKALPSAEVLARLPLKLKNPEHWDDRDRRAAKSCVSLGSPESLLPHIGAYSWESPERLNNAWVAAMKDAGLPTKRARDLLLRHEGPKSISPGLSDSLGLLARRESLADLARSDTALKAALSFGLGRAIKIIARNTGARFPTKELLAPFT